MSTLLDSLDRNRRNNRFRNVIRANDDERALDVPIINGHCDYGDPVRYGADPYEQEDSTIAIQAAIDVMDRMSETVGSSGTPTTGNRRVNFQFGSYRISDTLIWRVHTDLFALGGNNSASSPKTAIQWWGDPEVELVTNGEFASDTIWTKGTGWAISGGVATKTAGVSSDLEQTVSITENYHYVIEFDISGRTAGKVTPKVGGTAGPAYFKNRTQHFAYIQAGSGSLLEFTATSDFDGSIDNVKMHRRAVMIETEQGAWTNWNARMSGFQLEGQRGASEQADTAIIYNNRPDLGINGRSVVGCSYVNFKAPAIDLPDGCTNFHMDSVRWDGCESWCFRVGEAQMTSFSLKNWTLAMGAVTGTSGTGQGLMLLDYEHLTTGLISVLNFDSGHVELNGPLETWLPSEGDRDRALIAVGHNSTYSGENTTRLNAKIRFNSFSCSAGSGNGDVALVKMSETTDYISVMGSSVGVQANQNVVVLDNTTTPLDDMNTDNYGQYTNFSFANPDLNQSATKMAAYHADVVHFGDIRIPVIATASLPAAGAQNDRRIVIEDAGAGDRNLIIYAEGQRFRIDGGTSF